ncbi:MAG: hypothetical protein HKO65_11605 [Gemmatimonadetes bacterium]|nr:hypothetical protein [Gemmatimonadota bacterium]NNM05723.1 hypothetical protein [Gemmatimonadota bacterium]
MMEKLDPHFTFENFVVGAANRLASAAARRAAERPGVSYNPLFIYSLAGLGKTHILAAIARHVEKVYPDKEVEYLTPEDFLREFVGASGTQGEDQVRDRFKGVDILLLDDVQFLTAQSEIQELLLLSLDTLTGEGKQVVLACDRPPAELDGLGAHLRTRFEGGLLVDIGPPEYETRVAIITKRAGLRGTTLEAGVADAIGRFPWETVADLQEALDLVLATQEKDASVLTPDEVLSILRQSSEDGEEESGSELGQFLDELSDTVAEKVQAQEAPWRKLLREASERAEAGGFSAESLRSKMEAKSPPDDLDEVLSGYQSAVERLKGVAEELKAVGNPWPEAAHGLLGDPERLEEAEALLASAVERAQPFPQIPPGPTLEELGGDLPKLVIRAADQLVSTDRTEYNPLYVWSGDGAAAQALLQAAGRTKTDAEEGSRVALTSVGSFAEEFIRALSTGVAGAWRERWWTADLLLLQGAERLEGTERAQEELFHLFEALGRRRARVMIAADRPPSRISALDDRLRARLEGGLVVEVEVAREELSQELRDSLHTSDQPVAHGEGSEGGPPARVAEGAGLEGEAGLEAEAEAGIGIQGPEEPGHDVGADPDRKPKDVAAQDLEWIMSFSPKSPEAPGGDAVDQGEILDALAASGGGGEAGDAWMPSPEQVVTVWPRITERVAEEED